MELVEYLTDGKFYQKIPSSNSIEFWRDRQSKPRIAIINGESVERFDKEFYLEKIVAYNSLDEAAKILASLDIS